MNILQISPFRAYPPTFGGQQRVHGLVSAHDEHNITRVATQTLGLGEIGNCSKVERNLINNQYKEIIYNSLSYSTINKIVNTFGDTNWIHSTGMALPTICRSARNHPIHKQLRDQPDVIVVELPWLVKFVVERVDCPVVYSCHNIETEYFEALGDGNSSQWLKNKIRDFEEGAVTSSDLIVATCERDAKIINNRYTHSNQIYVAPNATTLPNNGDITVSPCIRNDGPTRACFIGSDAETNIKALDEIIQIAYKLSQESADIQIDIIGAVCKEIPDKIPPNVVSHGFVKDLSATLANIDIGLNPITAGAGTNVKIPEYLAHGLVVVTTTFGARGVPGKPDEQYIIRDIDKFPHTLIKLAREKKRMKGIAESGRQLAKEKLNWQSVSENFLSKLAELNS